MQDEAAGEDIDEDGDVDTSSPGAGELLEADTEKSEGKVDDEDYE